MLAVRILILTFSIVSKGDLSGVPADIWAMGVTLYCLVFGKLPFVGKTIIQLYESIRETKQTYPEGTDDRLVHLLNRLYGLCVIDL
jgi:[calcium/calmodulin-dependent protein kinase] kinase